MGKWTSEYKHLWTPEEGIAFFEAGATDGSEIPNMSGGIQTLVFWKELYLCILLPPFCVTYKVNHKKRKRTEMNRLSLVLPQSWRVFIFSNDEIISLSLITLTRMGLPTESFHFLGGKIDPWFIHILKLPEKTHQGISGILKPYIIISPPSTAQSPCIPVSHKNLD